MLPKTGGGKRSSSHDFHTFFMDILLRGDCTDTLWASGYEVYDRISPPYQKFLESLTATYAQPQFEQIARDKNFELHPGPRGAPENVGNILKAVHPVIRTNPVTGWKSVFAVGTHCQKVDGLSKEESAHLLKWFIDLIVENHDLQVRFRWQNPNDLGKDTPTRLPFGVWILTSYVSF